MVIISTSATEVSIQAVSPELGVHFSSTASLGSEFATQAGGGGSGAGAGVAAGAAGAGVAGACAEAKFTAAMLNTRLNSSPSTRASSPARENLNVMDKLLKIGLLREVVICLRMIFSENRFPLFGIMRL